MNIFAIRARHDAANSLDMKIPSLTRALLKVVLCACPAVYSAYAQGDDRLTGQLILNTRQTLTPTAPMESWLEPSIRMSPTIPAFLLDKP